MSIEHDEIPAHKVFRLRCDLCKSEVAPDSPSPETAIKRAVSAGFTLDGTTWYGPQCWADAQSVTVSAYTATVKP